MATVLYGINRGQIESQVLVTNPGPGVTSRDFEIQIDLTKFTTSADVAAVLDIFENYIIKTWHP